MITTCGICSEVQDCANCIDQYGKNTDCGWPICRRCRDEGPPAGNVMPEASRKKAIGFLMAMMGPFDEA